MLTAFVILAFGFAFGFALNRALSHFPARSSRGGDVSVFMPTKPKGFGKTFR